MLCGEGHYDHGRAMSVDAGQRKNDTRTAFLDLRALRIAVGQIDPIDVAAREVRDKCLAAVSAERASTSSEIARTSAKSGSVSIRRAAENDFRFSLGDCALHHLLDSPATLPTFEHVVESTEDVGPDAVEDADGLGHVESLY